jgi:hypothetical protein
MFLRAGIPEFACDMRTAPGAYPPAFANPGFT